MKKLIALSKLFGVSVGALLGVEEEAAPPQEAPELTEQQLKMVEEITERYLAARPKPKYRKWLYTAIALAVLLGVFSLINRLDQINQQYQRVQMTVSHVQDSVDSQINGIASQVEDILKAQNSLTAEYDTEQTAADSGRNTITFSAYAVPKTFTEGMAAVFTADSGDGPAEFPATLEPGRKFTCEITCSLTDSIALAVVFLYPDGTQQNQVLDTYEGLLSASLPLPNIRTYLFMADIADRTLTLSGEYATIRQNEAKKLAPDMPSASVEDLQLGVFRNQELLGWATPCEQPEHFRGDFTDQQFYRLPDLMIEDLTESDKLYIAALVTDNYGRQFMASEIPFVVEFEDSTERGRLTYPSDGRYDNDPANWSFE